MVTDRPSLTTVRRVISEAVRDITHGQTSEILVLGRDDKIGSREHYGHDLYSPKGKTGSSTGLDQTATRRPG
jgi:hypothetical protein